MTAAKTCNQGQIKRGKESGKGRKKKGGIVKTILVLACARSGRSGQGGKRNGKSRSGKGQPHAKTVARKR